MKHLLSLTVLLSLVGVALLPVGAHAQMPPPPPAPPHYISVSGMAERFSVAPSLPGQLVLSQSVNVTFALE